MKTLVGCLLTALACSPPALAQRKAELKWGKVSPEEIRLTHCAYDSTAAAVVLFDRGEVTFVYGSDIIIRRHVRLKVLSAQGFDEANIILPYYVKNQLERITDVDAQTLNTDAAGKVTAQPVANNQVFDVAVDENWKHRRFGFPAVRVGSILEYRFVTYSRNFSYLEGWTFENDLPTLVSQFTATIPEGLDYRALLTGRRLLDKYPEVGNSWELRDLPALRQEPFVAHYLDYANRIRFQLAGYQTRDESLNGGSKYVTTMTTWEKLAQELLEDDQYTRYLTRHGVAKDALARIIVPTDDPLGKVRKICAHVTQTLAWNGDHRIFTQQTLPAALEKGRGSTAEISLYLTLLLREAGLMANPLLLSTRPHGAVFRGYPFLAQFNTVLVHATVAGKDYVLDATSPLRPFDLPDDDTLSDGGYLLARENPRWIEVKPPANTRQTVLINADFSQSDQPRCRVDQSYAGYAAWEQRQQLAKQGNEAFTRALLAHAPPDFLADSARIREAESIDKPLLLSYDLRPEEPLFDAQTVYLKPLLINQLTENPYKDEQRYLPVEWPYPRTFTTTISLKIPANYQFQETPAPVRLTMVDRVAEFSYLTSVSNGNTLQVQTTLRLRAVRLSPTGYLALRQFYAQLLAKLNETVVLSRK